MKQRIVLLGLLAACAASAPSNAPNTSHTAAELPTTPATPATPAGQWDLDQLGVPPFIMADYIESARVTRVSYFRSSYGHDYSDDAEHCRSMKHYFDAGSVANPTTIGIFVPVTGRLVRVEAEQTFGTQIQIQPDAYPQFTVVIFHVAPDGAPTVGDHLVAGARLGHHIGSQTASDVAIRVQTPTASRLVSYFDALTDSVWARYAARGVVARSAMGHTRAARDADALTCNASGAFSGAGSLAQWVTLR